jgi:ATP-dependent helicase/nuclease subunit A
VKQSIYRFRLADPEQFIKREGVLRRGAGEVIDLRQNFRSRGPLLEAINAVFGRLMTRSAAEVEYDETQRLVPGRAFADAGDKAVFAGAPIELHVLAKSADAPSGGAGGGASDAGANADDDGDAGWDRTEREAAFVARRILQIVGRDGSPPAHVYDRDGAAPRPASYRDIVILLRSKKYKAAQFVRILEGCGVPTHAESGSGFFEATEVRDVIALLCLLDNQSQDLELAAYLRSPLAKLDRPEDAMATVRVAYRGGSAGGGGGTGSGGKPVPFHEAVVRYAAEKTDALAADLRRILAGLADLRREANRQPVHETVWQVYDRTGYLAYVAGLPGGNQRQANLTELYDRARRFANHRRQGLGRFLEFLNTLSAETDVGQPSLASEAMDVVRVLTVHASKGLEFPIVFVPDCGKRINLMDTAGPILLDRHRGVGLAVADEERFARYPSLAQVLVKDQIHRRAMAEELRVLYVALTRAMEHLILVGTAEPETADGWTRRWAGHVGPLPESAVVGARSVLDWVGPVWAAGRANGDAWIELQQHALEDLEDPKVKRRQHDRSPEVRAICELKPLDEVPGDEMPGDGKSTGDLDPDPLGWGELTLAERLAVGGEASPAELVIDRLTYAYPHEPRTRQPAAASVTGTRTAGRTGGSLDLPTFMTAADVKPTPALVGSATHAALQHLRFAAAVDRRGVERELDRMAAYRQLLPEQHWAVDVDAIEWFVGTDLGRLLREHEPTLLRELQVYAATDAAADGQVPSGQSPAGRGSGHDVTMLRGRVDVLVPLPGGAVVVDYKTDTVRDEAEVAARADQHREQLRAYADVIGRLSGTPVAKAYVVFLSARQVVEV